MKKFLLALTLTGIRYKLVLVSDAWGRTYNHILTNLDTGKVAEFVRVQDGIDAIEEVI